MILSDLAESYGSRPAQTEQLRERKNWRFEHQTIALASAHKRRQKGSRVHSRRKSRQIDQSERGKKKKSKLCSHTCICEAFSRLPSLELISWQPLLRVAFAVPFHLLDAKPKPIYKTKFICIVVIITIIIIIQPGISETLQANSPLFRLGEGKNASRCFTLTRRLSCGLLSSSHSVRRILLSVLHEILFSRINSQPRTTQPRRARSSMPMPMRRGSK